VAAPFPVAAPSLPNANRRPPPAARRPPPAARRPPRTVTASTPAQQHRHPLTRRCTPPCPPPSPHLRTAPPPRYYSGFHEAGTGASLAALDFGTVTVAAVAVTARDCNRRDPFPRPIGTREAAVTTSWTPDTRHQTPGAPRPRARTHTRTPCAAAGHTATPLTADRTATPAGCSAARPSAARPSDHPAGTSPALRSNGYLTAL
jgi:hypothetical protein